MEQSLFEQLITLYIITYLENYKSAYNLMKPLSRKFGIFEFSRVIDNLLKRKYVIKTTIHPMSYYEISPEGKLLLREYLNELRQELKEKYLPNDPEYIKLILARSEDEQE